MSEKPKDLKQMREAAKVTQQQMAEFLGVDQAQVSRYEQDPDNAPVKVYRAYESYCGERVATNGFDIEDKHVYIRNRVLFVEEHMTEFCRRHQLRSVAFLQAHYQGLMANTSGMPVDHERIISIPHDLRVDNIRSSLKAVSGKPKVSFVGKFDTAKTTTINSLLGKRVLPSRYQPATSCITFIRHISERPKEINEEVLFFSQDFLRSQSGGLDPSLWDDLRHWQDHLVLRGDINTLKRFGAHDVHGTDDEVARLAPRIRYSFVFVEAPILLNATLVDMPGFGNDDTDSDRAILAAQMTDVFIYTSAANSFIDSDDMQRLSTVLPMAGTESGELSRFFLLMTHAGPQIKDSDIEEIKQAVASRLLRVHSDGLLKKVSREQVLGRIFPFWAEDPQRRKDFETELRRLLGVRLIEEQLIQIDDHVSRLKNAGSAKLSEIGAQLQKTLADLEDARKQVESLRAAEPGRKIAVRAKRIAMLKRLDDETQGTKRYFREVVAPALKAPSIEKTIRSKFESGQKKQAQQEIGAILTASVTEQLNSHIHQRTSLLAEKLEAYLGQYQQHLNETTKGSLHSISIALPFDAKGAFIGGLAGLATIGGLATWASIVAAGSNLGAYILIAKAVSILSAFGIGTGGVASVMTFVSAIGGPFTIAIAAAALVGLLAWALFGEDWQSRLAKKVAKMLQEKGVEDSTEKSLDQFWASTKTAFEKGADAAEAEFENYLHQLTELAKADPTTLKTQINEVSLLRTFFDEIPWLPISLDLKSIR